MFTEARKRRFTVEEFHRMGEAGILDDEARLELLDGEIFEMPPVGGPHGRGVDLLTMRIAPYVVGRAIVRVQGNVILDDHSEPLPDITLFRWRDDFYGGEIPTASDVLLIVEVSDSSLRHDRQRKLPRYAAAGVPEVWIAALRRGKLERHLEPREARYTVVDVLEPGASVAPEALPDVVLDVAEILGR